MLAARELLGLDVVGGLYQPLGGDEHRAARRDRGRRRPRPPASCGNDRLAPEELEELLGDVLDAALEVVRRHPRRAPGAAARRRAAGATGLCVSVDLPLRGDVTRAEPHRRAGRGRRAPPRAAARRRQRRLGQDDGAGRALRAPRSSTTAARPTQILAITFTEKAAGELRARRAPRAARRSASGAGAGHRVRVDLDDPRLLRADPAHPRRRRRPGPARSSSLDGAETRALREARSTPRWPGCWPTAARRRARPRRRLLRSTACARWSSPPTTSCAARRRPAPRLPLPGVDVRRSPRCAPSCDDAAVAAHGRDRARRRRRSGRRRARGARRLRRSCGRATRSSGRRWSAQSSRARTSTRCRHGLRRLPRRLRRLRPGGRRSRAGAALALIDELLARFDAAFAAAKRAVGGLDFDDLELCARDLLRGAPGDRRRLRRALRARSWSTSSRTRARCSSTILDRLDRDNTFVRRRRAAVDLRLPPRRRRGVPRPPRRAAGRRARRRRWPATSARAREILDALNDAFGPMLSDARRRRSRPAAEPRSGDRAAGGAAGHRHRRAGTADGRARPRRAAGRSRVAPAEARLVAQRVGRPGRRRRVAARDIVVLLRAATDMATYERALEDAGVATLASGGRGFWARQQIQDLTSYLAALANPRDEAALLGVLASPLVGISSDALALLAAAARADRATVCRPARRAAAAARARRRGGRRVRGRGSPPSASSRRGSGSTSCSSASSRAPATTCVVLTLPGGAAAGQRPQADAPRRRVRGTPRARRARASSSAPTPSSSPRRRASPTRRSTSPASTPCG